MDLLVLQLKIENTRNSLKIFEKLFFFLQKKRKQIVYKNALKEIREISKTFDFPILEM